ncbi:hypothetical protein TcWFU_006966 [Taenia crassiceps]|uniref:Uncharacterized protein n=1 Tax=Taenia crassiceps TaxID=6207 RepID=A0ABR4PZJ1_9CEST
MAGYAQRVLLAQDMLLLAVLKAAILLGARSTPTPLRRFGRQKPTYEEQLEQFTKARPVTYALTTGSPPSCLFSNIILFFKSLSPTCIIPLDKKYSLLYAFVSSATFRGGQANTTLLSSEGQVCIKNSAEAGALDYNHLFSIVRPLRGEVVRKEWTERSGAEQLRIKLNCENDGDAEYRKEQRFWR